MWVAPPAGHICSALRDYINQDSAPHEHIPEKRATTVIIQMPRSRSETFAGPTDSALASRSVKVGAMTMETMC